MKLHLEMVVTIQKAFVLFQLAFLCLAHYTDAEKNNETIAIVLPKIPYEKKSYNISEPEEINSNNDDLKNINSYITILSKSHCILKYYSILVVIFGTIFNLINFFCFYQMKKRNSQNIYLIFLSLADLFNIQINISVPLVRNLFLQDDSTGNADSDNEKRNLLSYKFFCILDGYLVEIGLLLPAWIMVLLAAERFIIIMWPLQKNVICTSRHAKMVLSALVMIVLTLSFYKFWTAGIETDSIFRRISSVSSNQPRCRNIEYMTLVNISTTFQMIIPPFCCLVFNILIIKIIKQSPHTQFYPSKRNKKINQTTYTVISLSIIFVILVSPTGVLIIIDLIINGDKSRIEPQNIKNYIILMIARKYALILYETNMVINFPIYILTIKNFRETLKRNLLTRIFLKIVLKRQNSTEIGQHHKDLHGAKDRSKRIKKNTKIQKINVLNISKYKMGKHYELAHSVIDNDKRLDQDTANIKNGLIHYRKNITLGEIQTMKNVAIGEKEARSSFPDFSTHYSK